MRLPRLSLGLPLVAFALMLSPGSALGAANHPFLGAIPGAYEDACGVALQGGLYVSDYYHDAIVTPSGKISNVSPGDGPCKLAFDSGGNLYVNNWHKNVVKYTEPFNTPTVIDSDNPTGLTVDPLSGNVYVAHRTYIAEYEPSGEPVRVGGEPVKIGLNPLGEYYGVAISNFPTTAGDLYVPDAASHTVKVFNSAGALIEEMDGSAAPQGGFSYLIDSEVAVDNSPTSPSYGHIYVLDAIGHGKSEHPEGAFDEFNAAGDYRGQITGFVDAEPSGIAIESTPGPTTGNVYLTSGNSEGSQVFEYGPTAPARTLNVVKSGAGEGSITSSPKGIVCGTVCSTEFNEGQLVTLFASPDSHSVFAGWTVSGSEPCPGAGSCTVSMANNVEVSANFEEPTQETLTVSTTGSGTVSAAPGQISCPGSCSEHFNQGRVVTLTAHPSPHNKLVSWSGCTVQANPAECKVTMSAAQAVSAQFDPIPQLTLSVLKTASEQGTVTSFPGGISCPGSCSAQFDEGATVYLVAAPAPISSFAGFSGGGCSGLAPLCAVTMNAPQSVSAEFLGLPQGASSSQSQTVGHLKVEGFRVSGTTATVTLVAPEAGTVFATGKGLTQAEVQTAGGKTTLRLSLSRSARRALRRSGRLRVGVTLAFLPESGKAVGSASRSVEFKMRRRAAKVEHGVRRHRPEPKRSRSRGV
jgi:hypothetical protein